MKPRNYHAKHMIINRTGTTKVIPNKKKKNDDFSISDYLEELEDDSENLNIEDEENK